MPRRGRSLAGGGSMSGRLGIVGAAMVISGLATLAGQAPPREPARPGRGRRAARTWVQPRTPDGQPDLQGFWSNSTYVPLERPAGVTKEFYTPEEAAAIRKAAASRESAQTKPGTVEDVHYDFSQFGLDRSQAAQAPNLRTSLIVDPPDGKIPPMTEEGRRRVAAREAAAKGIGRWDSAESNQLDDRCLIMAGAGPPMMDAAYNSNYHIVQAPGYVMILTEMIHDVRVIPLDGRPAPPSSGCASGWAMSRGRWEGDTLVVETTNFNGKNPFRNSSDGMRVTERFRRVVRRRDPVPVHHRRPGDVDAAVDGGDADAEDHRAALRARVPRGQLRPVQHAGRGPARGDSAPPRRPARQRNRGRTCDCAIGTWMWVTALAACGGAGRACRRSALSSRPPAPAYRAPRAPDGRPNLNGIWQAMNTANWDIEAHSAASERRCATWARQARCRPVWAWSRAARCPTGPRRWRRRRRTSRTG